MASLPYNQFRPLVGGGGSLSLREIRRIVAAAKGTVKASRSGSRAERRLPKPKVIES